MALLRRARGLLTAAIFFIIYPILLLLGGLIGFVFGRPRRRRGTVGFFHPASSGGGGGERVLWCAIEALQRSNPSIHIILYTSDPSAPYRQQAEEVFGIRVQPLDVVGIRGSSLLQAHPYPHFTMLLQSLGGAVVGLEALLRFPCDVFIDSVGVPFTLPVAKWVYGCRTAAYVHYPTVSTDMISRVVDQREGINNDDAIARSRRLSNLKVRYYRMFSWWYSIAGKGCEVVMANSTWTSNHLVVMWGKQPTIVYPPCNTAALREIPLEGPSRDRRVILSLAQFRPEKDHELQLRSFAQAAPFHPDTQLIMVGGARTPDAVERVERLHRLAEELGISDRVKIESNVPRYRLMERLAGAWVGIHTMRDEHFGISVVELMAAGVLPIAHRSGGVALDIVQDGVNGYLATDERTYKDALCRVFDQDDAARTAMLVNGRDTAVKFTDAAFAAGFLNALLPLGVALSK